MRKEKGNKVGTHIISLAYRSRNREFRRRSSPPRVLLAIPLLFLSNVVRNEPEAAAIPPGLGNDNKKRKATPSSSLVQDRLEEAVPRPSSPSSSFPHVDLHQSNLIPRVHSNRLPAKP